MDIEFETGDVQNGAERDGGPHHQRGRRRRIVAGVGAAMLVAAAGGVGFGIGRSIGGDTSSDQLTTAAETASPSSEQVEPADPTDPPTTEPATPAAGADAEPAREVPFDESAAEPTTVDPASSEITFDASGGPGWTMFGVQDMDVIYERTTESGLTLRAHLGDLWEEPYYGEGDDWQPPAWCFENGQARVSMTNDVASVIDVGGVPWYVEPFQGRSISWLTLGHPDGQPHRVVFVQAPADATSVSVAFGDGAIDSTVPVGGVAILVAPGAPEIVEHDDGYGYTWFEELPDFDVTFEGAGGATVVTDAHTGSWNDPEFASSCSPPPPALPEPGEQPTDPAAAEAAIRNVMDQLYSGEGVPDDLGPLLDDTTGVAEAREQIAEGGFETEANSATAVIEELVFTTPTEAWFRYRIETDGIDLSHRYGIAVELDGVWKITRATICQDLSMAGGLCEPPPEPIIL